MFDNVTKEKALDLNSVVKYRKWYGGESCLFRVNVHVHVAAGCNKIVVVRVYTLKP